MFRYSRYRASYISVVLSTVLLTLARACINLIISYKFLLETAHGFQYGVLIAVQIIASSFFAPKLVHLLDRLERPSTPLLLFYFLSAVLYGLMAQYSSFNSFVCFTFASTLLIALESAILYKLVPMVFREKEIKGFNVWAEQATALSFLLSALLVPFTVYFIKSYEYFFIVAGILQIIIGFIVYRIFYPIRIPLEQRQIAKKTTMTSAYRLIFADRGVRHFFFTSNFYLFAFSATAFSLAMIAKNVVGNNIYLYSFPIIAMFSGRILALFFLKRYLSSSLENIFTAGCFISAVFMFPLGLVNHVYFLSGLEFFLGVGIALAKFSERSFYQLQMETIDLSKMSVVRNFATIFNKSISVPFVLLLTYYGNSALVSACLAAFYLTAGIIMFQGQKGSHDVPFLSTKDSNALYKR